MGLKHASLLVIDFQEKLFPSIEENWVAATNARFLIKSFKELGYPIFFTEQHPEKLGKTISEIEVLLKDIPKIEKITFSCLACNDFEKLDIGEIVVVSGIETHICVFQTVTDMLENGHQVIVAEDACGSRQKRFHEVAIEEMRRRGAAVLPSESIIYWLLQKAATDEFRRILSLVKEKDDILKQEVARAKLQ